MTIETKTNTIPLLPDSPRETTFLDLLRRARWTWWRRSVGRALVIAGTVAAAVVPLAWIAALFSVEGRTGSAVALPGLVVPALMVFVASLLITLALTSVTAPSLLELARRADRELEQDQRLSTSFEVQARGGPESVVARLLVDDAERRAATLDWSVVGRLPWPRWMGPIVVAVLAISIAAVTVPVPARMERAPVAATAPIVDVDRAARDAETVRQFAELLAEVSQTEDSPYLQAVAASFADLAERIAEGTIDSAEASRTLEELAGHLSAAAREVSPAFADAVDAAFGDAAARAELGSAGVDPSGAGSQADAGDGADQESGSAAAPPGAAAPSGDASMYLALEDLGSEMAQNAGGLGLRTQRPQALDPLSDDAFYAGVLNADADPNAAESEPSGLRAQAEGAGDAVGGAEQSSERAGDAIGGGSADLGGGGDGFLDLESETVAAGALPWSEREDGRYVEVELVPDAVLGEARAFVRDVAGLPFQRSSEAASTARSVGATYREVVGRYFTPGAVQAGGTP